MYLTNNSVEFIHCKIDLYLSKHKTNEYSFINALQNIIFNDSININNLARYDYKTKTLLIIIN